jgi:beta-galactosidase
MKRINIKKSLLGLLICSSSFLSQATTADKVDELNSLITTAESQNIDTTREKMTLRTSELFLKWALWDEENVDINTDAYLEHSKYKSQAVTLAENLPTFQRTSVDIILDKAIEELIKVNSGIIVRKPVPLVDFNKVVIKDGQFKVDNTPVFLSAYTWKPDDEQSNTYFGNLNSQFIAPSYITNEQGAVNQSRFNDINNSIDERIGQVFVAHKNIPQWAYNAYSNFEDGSRLFHKYDIDHEGAKTLFSQLFEKFVPALQGKRSSELGYMLFNEPSFFTQEGLWNSGGVSEKTIVKFKTWLSEQHNSITALNTLWGSAFTSFDDITITIPMSSNRKGSPIWYDWMRFNQIRVTQWFKFLDSEIKKNDQAAKTHIKLMPWLWNQSKRDHGIDFESLLEITDIIGFDANSQYTSLRGAQDYQTDYSFDWQSATMSFDFFSSIQPNQVLWDSENHFFTNVTFQERNVNPEYIRAIYWLASTHGLSGASTWVWSREEDGSYRQGNIGSEYVTDITRQPIGLNELTLTLMDITAHNADIHLLQKTEKSVRIFYSETSAITQDNYMEEIRSVHKKMFFDGLALGFATEKLINKQTTPWPVIIVKDSQQVTAHELQALKNYVENGGTLLVDENSLTHNEYNQIHPANLIPSGERVLRFNNDNELREKALATVKAADKLPVINVVESGIETNKKVTWRVAQKDESTYLLSLVNTGKSSVSVDLQTLDNQFEISAKNLLTSNSVENNITLNIRGTLFLELTLTPRVITSPDPAPNNDDDSSVVPAKSTGSTFYFLISLLAGVFIFKRTK